MWALATVAASASTERVIVRFPSYAPAHVHGEFVARALGPERRHWRRAPTRRPRGVPTDFLALHIARGTARALARVGAVVSEDARHGGASLKSGNASFAGVPRPAAEPGGAAAVEFGTRLRHLAAPGGAPRYRRPSRTLARRF